MSSNCPPQLQLSLQSNTTSFKRSFEQFGFDLESPGGATDAGGSGGNNGNDRNKRARSASSFSEGSDSMDSSHLSTIASGSSGSSPSRHEDDANDPTTSSIAVLGATHSALEPPRLPTPDIQDIEMPDYPVDNSESFAGSLAPQVPDPEDRYRLPMDRYNPFRNETGLRRPQSTSSLVTRSPTAPPVLPPLYISEDQTRLSTSPISFLHSSPQLHSTSLTGPFFDDASFPSIRYQSPTASHDNSLHEEQGQQDPLFQNEYQPTHDPLSFSAPSNRLQSLSNNTNSSRSGRRPVPPSLSTSNPTHFRDHLNSALDLLRSSSPLVPGLEDVGREAILSHSHVNNRISRALPNPPTLPLIVTNTDDDISHDVFTPDALSASSSATTFDSSASASSSRSLDLGDHPLPSPVLHDLHSWMDASTSSSAHSWDNSQISTSSVTTDSRQDFPIVTNDQGTFATSSAGQSRADRGYTPQQLTSSSPTVLTSPPLRHRRFMRMSDLEGNRRETSMLTFTSTSASQSNPELQSNANSSSIGLPPLPFNRRSADEVAVRSLDQAFDSRLPSLPARPALGGSSNYLDRYRVHENQLADEADTGDRERTFQRNLLATTLERRHTSVTSRESLGEFLRRTGEVPDTVDNGSTGLPLPTPQATARYPDPNSQMSNSSTFAGSRTGFNNNNSNRDPHLRHRLRSGSQMSRSGASNSLVNESAVEARRLADRLEVLERMNEVSREDSGSSISGALGDSLDSHLRSLEADLRENGMSSVGWDPTRLNRRSFGPTNDSEDSRRPWYHGSWRQPLMLNRRSSYLPSMPQHSILPLPGLSSNDDMDMMIGESIGFRPADFTSGSALSNNNTRNNSILPSSLYDNPMSSRTAGRPSDNFWLNSSRPTPTDQNSMDTSISSELPSTVSETDIFNSRYSTIPDMANIGGTSSSRGGGQRRLSASSDSSHSDNETQSNQPYLSDPPSLPPPDLGGVFDAERHASSIAISDETPETIFVHPPRRPDRDASGISQFNLPFADRPPPSIPIQEDANSATANNSDIRFSYADIRRQPSTTTELEALIQRQRRSQLEARRISALAEEIRGMVGSSGNNPVSNSINTQAQSISDLNRSSLLGRNITIEPTERRNHSRAVPSTTSEPPFPRYQGLDPSSFTPGPFRNTVQQLFNDRRHSQQRRPDPSPSVPPTIPPLSFDDPDLSSTLHQRILLHQLRRPTETTQVTTSTSTRDTVDDRQRRERAIAEEGLRREQQHVMNLRRMSDRLAAARGMNESNRRRETSDIHRYLTQQARMEASRLADPEIPITSRGLSNAIDVLRHDDLNSARTQQLIERFHREREGIRSRVIGTEPESIPVTMSTPGAGASSRRPDGRRFLRESIMRRETGLGDEDRRSVYSSAVAQHINQEEQRDSEELGQSQSMRGRRGRFPRTPGEVMFSLGRHARRVGAFGDYMRDEDFDESYEGLLSLSAALGEVKPKSTPASILSELETAQYKDWATSESDQRCPICLDDYQPTDQVLKLNNCSHWLHKDCLQQWLQGARTCPVCRKSVYMTSPQTASSSARRLHPRHPHMHYPIFGGGNPSWRRDHHPPHPPPPPPPGVDPI